MWIAFVLALALAGAACADAEEPAPPVAEVGDDLVVMTQPDSIRAWAAKPISDRAHPKPPPSAEAAASSSVSA